MMKSSGCTSMTENELRRRMKELRGGVRGMKFELLMAKGAHEQKFLHYLRSIAWDILMNERATQNNNEWRNLRKKIYEWGKRWNDDLDRIMHDIPRGYRFFTGQERETVLDWQKRHVLRKSELERHAGWAA